VLAKISLSCFAAKGGTIRRVNIRDERTVGEQVKSGLRLAGWVLLTLAFVYLLLGSTGFLIGKGAYTRPIHRVLGVCGLAALSTTMFVTVRHWVKWFIGVLGYFALKAVFALLLGSSIAQPRLWFVEFALLLGLAVGLCARYLSRKPETIEEAALVGLVVALSFTLVCDSVFPFLSGLVFLTLVQLTHSRRRRTTELI
jgi:hypothetical protein